MKNYTITINGNKYAVTVEEGNGQNVAQAAAPAAAPKAAPAATGAQGAVAITMPMPGKITGINVQAGASVKKGQVLLTFEAMKMENEITAPQDGTVASINCQVNTQVEGGTVIATLN
ncbi:MAG: acetyl-CoA carboxylase biotin carboxyl carrier protein subunit [Lachnospiraceae bacterium]|nr:acetyl-CoA carboxylase biotin carboxyl carrier protein subunit [Lachnospiraceae bacterium]